MSATSPTKLGSLTPGQGGAAAALTSNLPFELLQLIFGYCTEFEDLPVGSYRTCPSWMALTHVCSRWRAAALNCSSLWTLINTGTMRKRWIEVFLERSKASLIDVTVALRVYTSTFTTRYLLDVDEVIALFTGCTRLRSLNVIGAFSVVYKLLDTLHTAIHIRSLSLDINFGFASLGTHHANLPENLLGDRRPSVRYTLSQPARAISSHRGGFFAASPTSHLTSGYPCKICSIPCTKCLYSIPSRWSAAS
jgi:hypothetical protein